MASAISGLYRDVLDNMDLAVAIYRATDDGNDFIFIDINQVVETIEQIKKEDLIGKRVTEVFPGVEEFGLLEVFRSVYKTGVSESHPLSMYTDNRITGWRDNYVYKLESGEVVAVYRDLTEQKQVEHNLLLSEEKYRGLFDNMIDGVAYHQAVYDENGDPVDYMFLDINERFTELVGLDRDIIGKNVSEVLPGIENDPADWIRVYGELAKKGGGLRFEQYAEPLDTWYNVSAYSNKPGYFATIFQDVTDKIKYQRRLEALHSHANSLSLAESIYKIATVTVNALKTIFGYQWIDFNIVQDNKLVPLLISDEELVTNMELSLDGKGVIVRAYNTGESQIVSNAKQDKDYVHGRGDEKNEWLSELAVPVKINETVVAVLNIEDIKENNFTEKDAELVEILAEHVSSAMSRIEQTENLIKSEEKYRTFLESSMDAIFVVDEEKYLYLNQQAAQMLGYTSPEELIGTDAFIHVAPEYREEIKKLAKARQAGVVLPSLYDMKLIDREGNEIDVEVNVTATEYMGKYVSLAINRDISQRKRLEDVLQEVQSLSQWGYFERNIKTGKRFWSNGMYRLCGIDPNDVDPDIDYASDRIHPDDRDYTLQVIEEAQISKKSFEVDFRFLRDDGEIRIIRSHGQFTYDEQGNPILRRGSWQDITKHRQADDRLSLLHKISLSLGLSESIDDIAHQTLSIISEILGFRYSSFQLLEDNVLVTVNYFDDDNPTGGNSSAYMRLPIEGKGVTAKVAREGKSILLNNLEESFDFLEGTTDSKSELAVPIIFGQIVLGVLNIESPEFDAFMLDDVKLMEILAQHVAYAIMRIQVVKEREVFNQLLLEEKIKAEQALEMEQIKSNFISTATHEIRTPVTSIIGYLDLMFLDPSLNIPENIKRDIEVVHRNALRLVNLTNDLLDVQRISSGRFEVQTEPVDLIDSIKTVIEEMSSFFINKKQVLTVEAPKTLVFKFDENRITQLLTNLLRNANKFTPEEGKVIVRVESTESKVVIKVMDTGVGLSVEDIGKLFNPFPGIRHGLGVSSTGLGLAICKGIVDVHQGSINASSDGPGKGSTFTVMLPR